MAGTSRCVGKVAVLSKGVRRNSFSTSACTMTFGSNETCDVRLLKPHIPDLFFSLIINYNSKTAYVKKETNSEKRKLLVNDIPINDNDEHKIRSGDKFGVAGGLFTFDFDEKQRRSSCCVTPLEEDMAHFKGYKDIINAEFADPNVAYSTKGRAMVESNQIEKDNDIIDNRTPAQKSVSFAPEVSPEIFDKRLPPNTPIRRGSAPPQVNVNSAKRSSLKTSGMIATDTENSIPIQSLEPKRRSERFSKSNISNNNALSSILESPLSDEDSSKKLQGRNVNKQFPDGKQGETESSLKDEPDDLLLEMTPKKAKVGPLTPKKKCPIPLKDFTTILEDCPKKISPEKIPSKQKVIKTPEKRLFSERLDKSRGQEKLLDKKNDEFGEETETNSRDTSRKSVTIVEQSPERPGQSLPNVNVTPKTAAIDDETIEKRRSTSRRKKSLPRTPTPAVRRTRSTLSDNFESDMEKIEESTEEGISNNKVQSDEVIEENTVLISEESLSPTELPCKLDLSDSQDEEEKIRAERKEDSLNMEKDEIDTEATSDNLVEDNLIEDMETEDQDHESEQQVNKLTKEQRNEVRSKRRSSFSVTVETNKTPVASRMVAMRAIKGSNIHKPKAPVSEKQSKTPKTLWSHVITKGLDDKAFRNGEVNRGEKVASKLKMKKSHREKEITKTPANVRRKLGAAASTGHAESPSTIYINKRHESYNTFNSDTNSSNNEVSFSDLPPTPDPPSSPNISPLSVCRKSTSPCTSAKLRTAEEEVITDSASPKLIPQKKEEIEGDDIFLNGIKEMYNQKEDETPRVIRIKELFLTHDSEVLQSPKLLGLRNLLLTPKIKDEDQRNFVGVKKLLREESIQNSPVLIGVKELLKEKKDVKLEAKVDPEQQEKNPESPDLRGIKEMYLEQTKDPDMSDSVLECIPYMFERNGPPIEMQALDDENSSGTAHEDGTTPSKNDSKRNVRFAEFHEVFPVTPHKLKRSERVKNMQVSAEEEEEDPFEEFDEPSQPKRKRKAAPKTKGKKSKISKVDDVQVKPDRRGNTRRKNATEEKDKKGEEIKESELITDAANEKNIQKCTVDTDKETNQTESMPDKESVIGRVSNGEHFVTVLQKPVRRRPGRPKGKLKESKQSENTDLEKNKISEKGLSISTPQKDPKESKLTDNVIDSPARNTRRRAKLTKDDENIHESDVQRKVKRSLEISSKNTVSKRFNRRTFRDSESPERKTETMESEEVEDTKMPERVSRKTKKADVIVISDTEEVDIEVTSKRAPRKSRKGATEKTAKLVKPREETDELWEPKQGNKSSERVVEKTRSSKRKNLEMAMSPEKTSNENDNENVEPKKNTRVGKRKKTVKTEGRESDEVTETAKKVTCRGRKKMDKLVYEPTEAKMSDKKTKAITKVIGDIEAVELSTENTKTSASPVKKNLRGRKRKPSEVDTETRSTKQKTTEIQEKPRGRGRPRKQK